MNDDWWAENGCAMGVLFSALCWIVIAIIVLRVLW